MALTTLDAADLRTDQGFEKASEFDRSILGQRLVENLSPFCVDAVEAIFKDGPDQFLLGAEVVVHHCRVALSG